MVIKRSGDREPFDRAKVIAGLNAAVKARPVAEGEVEALAAAVEDEVRQQPGSEVTSERVGRAVLEHLRELDPVAAVRFASVYKGFDDLSDFQRELAPHQAHGAQGPLPGRPGRWLGPAATRSIAWRDRPSSRPEGTAERGVVLEERRSRVMRWGASMWSPLRIRRASPATSWGRR